jgi:uncharacterized protein
MKRTAEARRIRLPVAALKGLDGLYAELPQLDCKRLCQGCCGPVRMSRVEWERIIARVGRRPEPTTEQAARLDCPLLTAAGLCSVYDVRPLICRLWGLVPAMACPFGCVPERWLTDEEGHDLLRRADEIGR